jgi:hypothetical protein
MALGAAFGLGGAYCEPEHLPYCKFRLAGEVSLVSQSKN